jgi:hypothetical protein
MNWVFETYSNVYNTAMMQDVKTVRPTTAKSSIRSNLARLFGRS